MVSDLDAQFEEFGVRTIRTLLFDGSVNSAGLPEVLQRITKASDERRAAMAWLEYKQQPFFIKAINWAKQLND